MTFFGQNTFSNNLKFVVCMITVEQFFRADIFPFLGESCFNDFINSVKEENRDGHCDTFHLYDLIFYPNRGVVQISEQFIEALDVPPSEYPIDFFLQKLQRLYKAFKYNDLALRSSKHLTVCFSPFGADFSEDGKILDINEEGIVDSYSFWSMYSAWRSVYMKAYGISYINANQVTGADKIGIELCLSIKNWYQHSVISYQSAATNSVVTL
jgi:hypothetical protein